MTNLNIIKLKNNNKLFDFSIIIPAFNNIELFNFALQSILTQQKASFEIIIVDDSTNDIIQKYITGLNNPLIRYIHNIPSLGAVKNWNYGLLKAKGEFLILLHHDEYFYENVNFLQHCLYQFETTACDAIISNSIVKFSNGNSRKQRVPPSIKRIIIGSIPSLLYSMNIIGPTSCIIFKKNILIPFNEELHWLVDVDWYYKLIRGKKIKIDNDIYIASFHGHVNQITNTINIKDTEKKDQYIIKKYFGYFSSVSFALSLRNCLYFFKYFLHINNNPFWKIDENS